LDALIGDIKSGRILSRYSHDNFIETVNGKKILNFDCSGFVYWYFRRQNKINALAEVADFVAREKNMPHESIKKIYSPEYRRFFAALSSGRSANWQIIYAPRELVAGDLIVYSSDMHRKACHCMLVHDVVFANDETARIRVVDATRFPHRYDTRRADEDGIGMGEIQIFSINKKWCLYRCKNLVVPGTISMARTR